jgi:hypothetical protein
VSILLAGKHVSTCHQGRQVWRWRWRWTAGIEAGFIGPASACLRSPADATVPEIKNLNPVLPVEPTIVASICLSCLWSTCPTTVIRLGFQTSFQWTRTGGALGQESAEAWTRRDQVSGQGKAAASEAVSIEWAGSQCPGCDLSG